MDRAAIDRTLTAVESSLDSGKVDMSSFWQAIAAIKNDPTLIEEFAERSAVIDRTTFQNWALLTVPIFIGTALMVLGTVVGLFLILLAYGTSDPDNGLLLLSGTVITLITTHGLTHIVAGKVVGVKFTHWFVGSVRRPQPGVKIDYATYLRTPARRRAAMHAAAAIETKIVPIAALGPALDIPVQGWVIGVLVTLAVGQILADAMWSVTKSDWKRCRRELNYAK